MFLLNAYNAALRPLKSNATSHDAKARGFSCVTAYFCYLVIDWEIFKSFPKFLGICPIILDVDIFEKSAIKRTEYLGHNVLYR